MRTCSRGTALGAEEGGRVGGPAMTTVKPIAAAVAGALISGAVMYTVGAKTATVDAFTQTPSLVQRADGQYVPASQLVTGPASQLVGTPRPQFVSSPATV